MATRRAHVLAVLTVANTAAVIVAIAAAAMSPGHASLPGLAWGISAGLAGGLGLIVFYIGVLVAAVVLRRGLLPRGTDGGPLLAAAGAGAIDVVANICYVAATRTGMFGLAVVLASLYPGVTVLMARVVLGERLGWIQRAGLVLAAIGVVLVAA